MRQWAPFDGGAVLDDVGAVLVDVVPGKEDIEELTRRLRGHLLRLVDIAVATEPGHKDQTADCLIGRARVLCAEGMADDRWTAVGHVRRMARCVNGLLELLVVVGCLKEPA
ncbi:DUF6415 family natural product biosynthesis protein [Streptomyces sp. NPDC056161]|uniref:DUF6415 family natural product biosynthesis protein n=1 Tax=Streptomyces sp. NPDC056161 TaxID=3345732 RepID=UPI0035E290E0